MIRGPIPAPAIPMSIHQLSVLKELQNKQKTGQQQVLRTSILLMAHEGLNNSEIKRALKISLNTVKTWRNRWLSAYPGLLKAEANVELGQMPLLDYRRQVMGLLENLPRSGAPKRVTLAQEQQIIALVQSFINN